MLCTFCGTENRPEHKFCGMCGVRLERRKEQRRVRQSSGTVTCQACGHLNDPQTKFCGMCGLRVERRTGERRLSVAIDDRAAAIANAQLPTPEAPAPRSAMPPAAVDVLTAPASDEVEARRAAENIFHSRPSPSPTTIAGPSFLGLGNDGYSEPGQNQYLLEEDTSSGGGRVFFFLIVLMLIGGLAYMGYRSGYITNLQAAIASRKPSAPVAAPQPGPAVSPASQAAAPTPANNPPVHASNSSILPALPGNEKDDPPTDPPENRDPPVKTASDVPASSEDLVQPKPTREIMPPPKRKPSIALIQAQNYLQGRGGVQQNCEQGLIYLKAATEKNDPAAAVQMGALYASGHCVQQDRVMAYRWFNSAHELDPANPWIQTNLDQLWAQMSPQERGQIAR